MKAWIIEDTADYDKGQRLVFADKVSLAKVQAFTDNGRIYHGESLEPDSWTDIRATRAKYADDMENEKELDIVVRLIENGWWFDIGGVHYDGDNLEEFKALVNK